MRTTPLLCWFLAVGALSCCCAHAISCNVTQEAGKTCYTVPRFRGTDCYYSWTNETGHVVANHAAKTDFLVVTQSINALTTNTCLKQIHYMRDCISEGIRHEVTCSTNCSGNGLFPTATGIHNLFWIIVVIIAAVGVGVVVVGLVVCFVRKRHCYRPVTSDTEGL